MENFEVNNICRCCLKNNGRMESLYGFSLDEMLRFLADIQVEPNDGLPELLCFQCVLQLSRAFRFKLLCQKSNETVLAFVKKATGLPHKNDAEIFYEGCEDVVSNFEENTSSLEITSNKEKSYLSVELPTDSIMTTEVEKNEFKCVTCNKAFNSRKQLVRHMKVHDTIKAHKCSECNKTFSQSCNLKKHMLKHSSGTNTSLIKQHLCSICGKSFKYFSSLSKHIKLHTGRNLLYCSHCPKFFLENTTLQNHLRCHTGDRPFICHHCNKSYTNSSNLKKHVRSHSGERPFKCNICCRTFAERNYLTIHLKTHDAEKNALCSKCGKRLANAKSLNAHMRIHIRTDKRAYKCGFENCNKSFSRSDAAAVHRRIHTCEKFFSCFKCSITFKTPNQLLNHSRTHIPKKSLTCNLCSLTFSSKTSLSLHAKKHYSSESIGHIGNSDNKHATKYQEEEKEETLEQPLLLFKLNENEELIHGPEYTLIPTNFKANKII